MFVTPTEQYYHDNGVDSIEGYEWYEQEGMYTQIGGSDEVDDEE